MARFPYKSYCWALGTTSFRTYELNVKIERQLALLDEFRTENTGEWQGLQTDYYRFMQERGFVKGDAPNPSKDAREKTSGLVDIGLLDGQRRLTPVGQSLLELSRQGNFERNTPLQIPSDSFIYLKQLLKTHCTVDGESVRPYAVFAYVLSKVTTLTYDEFAYLLPLCVNFEKTTAVINGIKSKADVDTIITNTLLSMSNYSNAHDWFLSLSTITASDIIDIGMNRKSGGTGTQMYDLPYYDFFVLLRKIALDKDDDSVLALLEQSKNINGKAATLWRKYLFKSTSRSMIKRKKLDALNLVPLFAVKDEQAFRAEFFSLLHLFKAKATLADYSDLNRRYFKTTDTVLFADGEVKLDIIPQCWLGAISDRLPDIAFTPSDSITQDIPLGEIAPFLEIDTAKLHADLESILGVKIQSGDDANKVINDERYRRFNKLVDEKFSNDSLVDLLGKFETRNDNEIRAYVTNNADIPTIFEYVLGIAWYVISGRNGDVLTYMNLSLEADLLPRTHAAGGNADIEWKYSATQNYPAHTLLIEATLAENSNQRRMEMEPVSRHLGDYILKSGDLNAYCIFVTTFLHINVKADFRSRRNMPYFSNDGSRNVDGMKIIPLQTTELKTILQSGKEYCELYGLFEQAYVSDIPIPQWYENEVAAKLG